LEQARDPVAAVLAVMLDLLISNTNLANLALCQFPAPVDFGVTLEILINGLG
jgi:hypothetical protein